MKAKHQPIIVIILIVIVGLTMLRSETRRTFKNGDIYVSGNDTFDVTVYEAKVTASEKMRPNSVLEEASPRWRNTTDMGQTFTSLSRVAVGSTQVYNILKRRHHE